MTGAAASLAFGLSALAAAAASPAAAAGGLPAKAPHAPAQAGILAGSDHVWPLSAVPAPHAPAPAPILAGSGRVPSLCAVPTPHGTVSAQILAGSGRAAPSASSAPHSRELPRARDGDAAIREELDLARRAGTREAYDLFIARHPDHPLARSAREERDRVR